MPKFVIYEVWTRSKVVEAKDQSEALGKNQPEPIPYSNLNLSNWHAQVVIDEPKGIDVQ